MFEGTVRAVTMRLGQRAIVANMQSNAASFEAWSLILRVWCDVEKVTLAWESPNDANDPHYQRLLYRADRFRSLFPDWFSVAYDRLNAESKFRPDGLSPLLLNLPSKARPTHEDYLAKDASRKLGEESLLELELCRSREFEKHYHLDKGRVERQIPVGLFRGAIAHGARVFTGGKSAIDLIGMSGSTLWLFELKAGRNIPAGIILRAISSMRRSCATRARPGRSVSPHREPKDLHVSSRDLSECENIEAVMLGEALHPLVERPEIVTLLNEAVSKHWKGKTGYPGVRFSVDRIVSRKPLEIRRLA